MEKTEIIIDGYSYNTNEKGEVQPIKTCSIKGIEEHEPAIEIQTENITAAMLNPAVLQYFEKAKQRREKLTGKETKRLHNNDKETR